jgi:ketosteroid isomerase-like protein
MDAKTAARGWADTWSHAWPQRDVEAIAALYAETAVYRSPAFRQPYSGLAGVRRYLGEKLPAGPGTKPAPPAVAADEPS